MEKAEDIEVPVLGIKDEFAFPGDHECISLNIEWTSKLQGIICDLDLNVLCYDERASASFKYFGFNLIFIILDYFY